jgi:hypothetical protein
MGSLPTFDAMGQFIGLMTDPFIAGRGAGFVHPPASASLQWYLGENR